MNEILNPESTRYWCIYNDDMSVFQTGTTKAGGQLTTGQPNLEHFDTEEELEIRVDELMGEGYYQSQKEETE